MDENGNSVCVVPNMTSENLLLQLFETIPEDWELPHSKRETWKPNSDLVALSDSLTSSTTSSAPSNSKGPVGDDKDKNKKYDFIN